jgi:hypothetical protein
MAKFLYHFKMRLTLLGLTTLLFTNCSTPNKEGDTKVLPEFTPSQHLLHVDDLITRKPPVYHTEKDFC